MAPNPKSSVDKSIPLNALTPSDTEVLHPNDTVQTAGERMREHDAAIWPVADDTKLVGMVDEKNPDWKIGGYGHDPKDSRVGQIMTRKAFFCFEDEDCVHAEKLMHEHGLSYLPVVDRQMRIIGVFNRKEIEKKVTDSERQKITRRALRIARDDGRNAFTEDDFSRAKAELAEGRKSE